VGWQGDGSHFLHAHGDIGADIAETPFYKYLVLQAINGRAESPEIIRWPPRRRVSGALPVPSATRRR
jgi:hypothetical protein